MPVLILLGLGTRFAALGLLAMTAVIQFLVYPEAYPTHGVWAAVLLYLMARGPGRVSVDAVIAHPWALGALRCKLPMAPRRRPRPPAAHRGRSADNR